MVKELDEITPPKNDDFHDILYSEVEEAINTLKINKSLGSDRITAELLQTGGKRPARQMHKLCNKAWKEGTIPVEWGKSILVPIPKKGDLSDYSNCRTISLINHTEKTLLTVLLNRLKSHLDPYISEEQAGFRKDRSTVHKILTLRLLAEKVKRQGKKIYNCFIDFQKAFDTIKHKSIRCRNKDGDPATKDLRKSTVIWGGMKQARRLGPCGDTELRRWHRLRRSRCRCRRWWSQNFRSRCRSRRPSKWNIRSRSRSPSRKNFRSQSRSQHASELGRSPIFHPWIVLLFT